jgi:hypothetical protein
MTIQHFNKKIKYLLFFVFAFANMHLLTFISFAQGYSCESITADADGGPSPLALVCLLARVLRVFIYAAGAVFIAVAAYGSWKIFLAMGDPKALAGGKQTWTYGVYGFFVVVGFFALFTVVASAVGVTNIASPDALLQRLVDALTAFLVESKITGY